MDEVYRPLLVLDDDPTGVQTVADVPVLTDWPVETIRELFAARERCIFFLTNTRALDRDAARRTVSDLVDRVASVCRTVAVRPIFLCRSDSTLRGHFPLEMEAVRSAWRDRTGEQLGPVVFIPALFEAHRITRNGVHGILTEDRFVPAHETEFGRDQEFSYSSARLSRYVAAKAEASASPIAIEPWGATGSEAVWAPDVERYAGEGGLDGLAADCKRRVYDGEPLMFQTAASFVRSWLALSSVDIAVRPRVLNAGPGLVVVGSYVDLSARQLAVLLRDRSTAGIELDVPHLLDIDAPDAVEGVVRRIVRAVDAGKTPVVYTTRSLVTEAGGHRSIGRRVSEALVSVVRALPFSPSFVIAKGGITSLTIMRDGFGVKAGRVAGPVMPGVPVVRIPLPGDGTSEVDYVIFPGNVGADDDLYNLYQTYTQRSDAR